MHEQGKAVNREGTVDVIIIARALATQKAQEHVHVYGKPPSGDVSAEHDEELETPGMGRCVVRCAEELSLRLSHEFRFRSLTQSQSVRCHQFRVVQT